MESTSLIIRADADPQIGTGHVMRCLALAQAWQRRGGQVLFVTAPTAPALETRLQAEGMDVVHVTAQPGSNEDARQTAAWARQKYKAWIAADGYHFDATYQRIIKDSGNKLLALDDYGHTQHYYADIILNQNLHAHEKLYLRRESATRLLLGSRYILLRREFLHGPVRPRELPLTARKMLVTLGGSDPENVTEKVLQALRQLPLAEWEATVVVGGSNPNVGQLCDLINVLQLPIHLEHNVANIARLMAWADMAISAAGSTAWELACMAVPSLLIAVADNQRPIAEHLDRAGTAINLGWHQTLTICDIIRALRELSVSGEQRRDMAQRGRTLIDGHGADRVVMAMRGDPLRLRRVGAEDCQLLWEWANDPEVRAVSFSSAPIRWQDHLQWFHAKLQDAYCLFCIAIDSEDVPVGQVRYDLKDAHALISLSLDRQQRSKGYGSALLRLSAHALFATTTHTTIYAYVKPENQASVRAFERAGYANTGMTITEGQSAVLLTLEKDTIGEGLKQ